MIITKLLQLLENNNNLMLEGLFDNYISDYSDNMDVIISFYEASYKLTMVERSKATQPVPIRKENTIKKLETLILKTSNILKHRFQPVFKYWLDHHALNDPHKWACKRVETQEDDYNLFDSLIDEYNRYAFEKLRKSSLVYKELINQISDKIEKFPSINEYVKIYLSDYFENQKQDMYSFLDDGAYDSEDGYEINGNHFEDYDSAQEYIDNFEHDNTLTLKELIYNYDISLEDFFNNLKSYDYDLYLQALIEIYEHIIFQEWFRYWKQKGIVKTRETVEKVYNTMLTKHSNNAKREMADISIILNTAHQNGNIVRDYTKDYGDNNNDYDVTIDNKVLKELSDGTFESFKTWQQDVEEAGF